jgi:uncharacterized membrane protein YgdD (TMEM256/DUF423 family)
MLWIRIGSVLMLFGVALGAFGAHALNTRFADEESRAVWRTAALYHLVHGLALLAVGWLSTLRPQSALIARSGWLFLLGVILFSGSLYLLSVTGIRKLGIITPFGGLAFLAGWLCLALAARP